MLMLELMCDLEKTSKGDCLCVKSIWFSPVDGASGALKMRLMSSMTSSFLVCSRPRSSSWPAWSRVCCLLDLSLARTDWLLLSCRGPDLSILFRLHTLARQLQMQRSSLHQRPAFGFPGATTVLCQQLLLHSLLPSGPFLWRQPLHLQRPVLEALFIIHLLFASAYIV